MQCIEPHAAYPHRYPKPVIYATVLPQASHIALGVAQDIAIDQAYLAEKSTEDYNGLIGEEKTHSGADR